MQTVIETPTFTKQVDKIWSEDERLSFIDYIVQNPMAGDVIPNTGGARKVRWTVKGAGKRGGVRVVYFNQDAEGIIYLVAIYQKSDKTNITGKEIKQTI
jgi:mRNA-degrading endonuclease RelE of RelBE toxin-antitoxin system